MLIYEFNEEKSLEKKILSITNPSPPLPPLFSTNIFW